MEPGREERIPDLLAGSGFAPASARAAAWARSPGGDRRHEAGSCVVIIRRDHATDKSFMARLDEARAGAAATPRRRPGPGASTDASGEPYVVRVRGGRASARPPRASSRMSIDWSDVVIGTARPKRSVTSTNNRFHGPTPRHRAPRFITPERDGRLRRSQAHRLRNGAGEKRCHTIRVSCSRNRYVAPVGERHFWGFSSRSLRSGSCWELLWPRLQGDPTEHLALVAKDERKPPPVAALVGCSRC
jgi:hypothetical protein